MSLLDRYPDVHGLVALEPTELGDAADQRPCSCDLCTAELLRLRREFTPDPEMILAPVALQHWGVERLRRMAADEEFAAAVWLLEQKRLECRRHGWRYFMWGYGSYQPEEGGPRRPGLWWPVQWAYIDFLDRPSPDFVVTGKARQLGFTTIAGDNRVAWIGGFERGTINARILLASASQEEAKDLIVTVRECVMFVPEPIRPKMGREAVDIITGEIGVQQVTQFVFPERHVLVRSVGAGAAARSKAVRYGLWDEAGTPRTGDPEDAAAALVPASARGQLVVQGTGNGDEDSGGDGQVLARMVREAEAAGGKNGARLFFAPSSARPDRGPSFRAEMVARMGLERATREYAETIDEMLSGSAEGRAWLRSHIAAAEELGAMLDEQWESGELILEHSETGIDWGVGTAATYGSPLKLHWFYAWNTEESRESGEAAEVFSQRMLDIAEGVAPLSVIRYDPGSSGAQAILSTKRVTPRGVGFRRIDFGSHKFATTDAIAVALARTYQAQQAGWEGVHTGLLAISPKRCQRLLAQMKVAEKDISGRIKKMDDQHVLDSFIALYADHGAEWGRQTKTRPGTTHARRERALRRRRMQALAARDDD